MLNWPDSYRQFGTTVDKRLDQVTVSTHGAISGTIEKRRQETEVVTQEMERLEAAVEDLTPLHRGLTRDFRAQEATDHTRH